MKNKKTKRPASDHAPKSKGPRAKQRSRGGQGADQLALYGVHAVRAALANPARRKKALFVSENAAKRLNADLLQDGDIPVHQCAPRELDAMVPRDAVHQGIVLQCDPLEVADASELFHLVDEKLILVLDQITDPHNVGAIMRSAVAFGAGAVIVTHRNSATETGVLAKSASGAMDMVGLYEVRHLSKALTELERMRFAVVGLDSAGPQVLEDTVQSFSNEKVALVLGAEGKGLRQQTRESCTHLARLDMAGPIKSLNVSNAAALSLYVVSRAVNR